MNHNKKSKETPRIITIFSKEIPRTITKKRSKETPRIMIKTSKKSQEVLTKFTDFQEF